MAQFCTKCGAVQVADAVFCDSCGNPLNRPSVVTSAALAPLISPHSKIGLRLVLLAVGALVTVLALGAGLIWWSAPEPASKTSFTRAVNDYFEQNTTAQDRLLCVSNVPYERAQIRLNSYDQSTRRWMDMLVRSGVYSGPETQSGGWFGQQYLYQLTATGKSSVRNGKLCFGNSIKVAQVTGFDQIQKQNGQSVAIATATLTIGGEPAWLAKSIERTQILQGQHKANLSERLPLIQVDKKWQVRQSDGGPGGGLFGGGALESPVASAAPVSSAGFLDQLKSWFSFGAAHPLVGKWNGPMGVQFEFTKNTVMTNGVGTKAHFTTKGNQITIKPDSVSDTEMVVKMIDKDSAIMAIGPVELLLKRAE